MLTMLSFGGGQDSAALLQLYQTNSAFRDKYAPGDFIVVISDTGNEHPSTYLYLKEVQAECEAFAIPFFWLKPANGYHSKGWHSLDDHYDTHGSVGSKAFPKTCTDRLKIQPIYKFLNDFVGQTYDVGTPEPKYRGKGNLVAFAKKYGKIQVILGIAAGEERRVGKDIVLPKWQELSTEKVYPLIDLGMNRAACQAFLRSVGATVPMPSCCLKCPWMNLQELLFLSLDMPEVYADWVRQEAVKLAKNTHTPNNVGVWGSTKTLPEMLEIAKQRHGHMTLEQLREYRFSHGHCVSSKH